MTTICVITKQDFLELTHTLVIEKDFKNIHQDITDLQEKASKWDAYEYWTTGGRAGHGAG